VATDAPDPRRAFTVAAIAERYGINCDKVRLWIKNGELAAVNVATRPTGRPRWRIAVADLLAFEHRRRAAVAPARPAKRRKRQGEVIEFF
jgi:hypothetical protein